MEKEDSRKFILFGAVFMAFVFMISSVSGGIGDWFNRLTGKVTDEPVNVTVAITGTSAVNITVYNNTLPVVTVSNDGTGNMLFYVVVYDEDGVNDINDTSVFAIFVRTGEPTRYNGSSASYCTLVGDLDANSANYSCGVDMWYFDEQGAWNIIVNATDLGNGTVIQNTTTNFTLPQLQGIEIAPTALTFPSVSPGDTNTTSNNHPLVTNNTGNYNSTNITVTGINLWAGADYLGVGNFTFNNDTGSSVECSPNPDVGVQNATILSNGTAVTIAKALLLRGNHTINNNQTGQETLFLCVVTIPSDLPSATYDTSSAGGWTLTQV